MCSWKCTSITCPYNMLNSAPSDTITHLLMAINLKATEKGQNLATLILL